MVGQMQTVLPLPTNYPRKRGRRCWRYATPPSSGAFLLARLYRHLLTRGFTWHQSPPSIALCMKKGFRIIEGDPASQAGVDSQIKLTLTDRNLLFPGQSTGGGNYAMMALEARCIDLSRGVIADLLWFRTGREWKVPICCAHILKLRPNWHKDRASAVLKVDLVYVQ